MYATFTVSYLTGELGMPRSTVLTGMVLYGLVLIALQPVFGALSDRIGRRPVNIFSVLFTAAFAYPYPYFLLLTPASRRWSGSAWWWRPPSAWHP